jgi:hypothetical protein
MKATNYLFLALLTGFASGLIGCQEEFQEIISPIPTETISREYGSGLLLSRISELDGSSDNIIDSSSCTSIVFPFTVIVNGASIEISSEDDYDLLEDIIDDLEDEEGSVAIQFPVNVILTDHSVVEANDMDELEDLIEACDEDDLDDYIDCVNIAYPITFSSYNDATQQAGITTVENDAALYRFLDDIEDMEIVSLNYPVELILSTGETITVENNEELETAIELYKDSCDKDDDEDTNDEDDESDDNEEDDENDDDNNSEEDSDEDDGDGDDDAELTNHQDNNNI